jgi:hypothetical protein
VPHRASIHAVTELKGHALMDAPGSDDIAAMLKHEGIGYADLPRITHSGNPICSAARRMRWSLTAPMSHLALPRAYGFDFYGDNLCKIIPLA